MADPSRQPFRFRLPWMINPLSNFTNQRATQPTATIPVQRTIRAPTVPLPPPPPPPPKTEPKPPSPARSDPQSGVAFQPQTQSRADSQPPSPSRTVPPSPSRTAPPSQVSSLPPSPPRTTPSQPQATQKTEPQPPSPLRTVSQTPLPSRTTPSQPQATQKTESQPPSPSRTISQTPLPSQITPSRSQAPPRMEYKTAPSSQVSPQTTPQSQASFEPQSPSRPTPSQSIAPPKMESKPTPPSPATPRTTPQSKSTSEPSSPSRTTPQSKSTSEPPSPSRTTTSQSQAPPKTESKPSPPSPAALQSGMSSQPPSPSRATKTQSATRTVSQPPSPSPTNTQVPPASRVPSKPSSPTRLASQAGNRTSPQSPSSSSRTTPKVATIQTTSQPPSPSRQVSRSQTKTQVSTNALSPPKSSVSKTEPSSDKTTKAEPTIFHPLSQDPQSQVPAPQSQNQIQLQAASAQAEVKRQPSQVLEPTVVMSTSTTVPPEIPATQPLKSPAVPIDPKKHQNLEAETKETKEEKPKLESSRKEDKPMIVVNEEPKQRKNTDFFNVATGSNKQPQGRSSTTSQGKHNHLNKQVYGDDKDMAQESKTKTTTRPQKDMNASSESQPRPSVTQGEQATLHKEIKENIFGVIHKLGAGHTTQGMDGPVSVITLTGENRGASMHVGAELARKEGSVHIHRGYKLNQDDKNEMTTDGESSSKRKSITKEDEASTAYINSNVQGINNSLMSNSSISERSPGVRWVLEHNQIEPVKNGNQKLVEAHKADFNVTNSQKLTYEPTVRRRCLRGLFLEPIDSDRDNLEKPRRHGCRYSCDEKKTCKDNGKEGTTIQF